MTKTILLFSIFIINTYAIDFGKILIDKNNKSTTIIAKDIRELLKQYDIDLEIVYTNSSYENIDKLINNKEDNFFAIVKKSSIKHYNTSKYSKYSNKSIYSSIPAILSLGDEQIHIFTAQDKEFDFEEKKKYKVYCKQKNSDSCIASHNIQTAYGFEFIYVDMKSQDIVQSLQNNTIDLYIEVKQAPYKQYKNFKNIKLIDLPTNFTMEEQYIHNTLKEQDYEFLSEDIHAFSTPRVLITNLKQKEYESIITNLIKIVLLNKKYLISKNKAWEEFDFEYFDFRTFLKSSRKEIIKLNKRLRQKDALIF